LLVVLALELTLKPVVLAIAITQDYEGTENTDASDYCEQDGAFGWNEIHINYVKNTLKRPRG
jgi:hypothetical protein